jgi:hypothetical protein
MLYQRAQYQTPDRWSWFSHSYGDGLAGSYDPTGRMDSIFRQVMDVEYTNFSQYAVAGSRLTVEGAAAGGWASFYRETSGGKMPSKAFPYTSEGGGLCMVFGINDLGTLGGATTQNLVAYQHALRSVISRWRASTIIENDASSGNMVPTYGGTWTAETGKFDGASSGGWRFHATTGGTITWTLPADYDGSPIALAFTGRPGVNGGTVTFSGTAGVTGTISTDNIMASATLSNCPVIKRITNLTSANAGQTIIATVTANNGLVYYDCCWIESLSPGPVIVANCPRLTAAGYTAKYPSWTAQTASLDGDVQALNAAVLTVVGEFDAMVQVADLDSVMNKDATLFADGLHPNDRGAQLCADALLTAVKNLSPNLKYGISSQFNPPALKAAAVRRPSRAANWYAPEFASKTTYTAVAGDMFAYPFYISESRTTWSNWGIEVTTANSTAGGTCRVGIFGDANFTGYPDLNIQELTVSATLSFGTTVGSKTTNAGGFIWRPNPGMYWKVVKIETIGTAAAAALAAIKGPNPFLPQVNTTGLLNAGSDPTAAGAFVGWKLTGQATGAFASTFPAGAVLCSVGPAVMALRS